MNPRTGQQCGTPVSDPLKEDPLKNRCGIDYVAPRVDVDYYSYSSWLTLDVKFEGPNGSYKQAIKRDLNIALAKVRERRPEVQEANFIIGEFGIHRTRWGENTTANYVSEMFDAIEGPDAFQVSYAIYWQIIDNIPFFWVWDDGFGLYTSRHGRFELNRIGQAFKRRISGQGHQPFTGGPLIRKTPFPGVLDSITHLSEFHLNPDSILEIYVQGCCEQTDTPFSTSGNIVRFEQGLRQYSIPRDNPAYFYESATQINASLPKGLRPGIALVYVQDSSGVESNGPIITLTCDSCPTIANVIDSPKGINEFHPSSVIKISGSRFSPSGNTVAVEQRDNTTNFYRFVIPQSDILQESTNQITARLPNNLIISQATAFIVTNAEGRESNE
ncbi:MAG TPA: hypothetical protein VEF04_04385, partial [Blastocatellia bacterium]|nr:hypothetical protein [Blastocatellia bacterium]